MFFKGFCWVRLLFVSHCFPLEDAPMSKIGGMQRVGIDLLQQLEARDDVEVSPIVLRSSIENDYARFFPFLWRTYRTAKTMMRNGEIDAVLFSAMPSAMLVWGLAGPSADSKVPLIAISHGHDVIADNAAYQWLVRKVLARLDAMLPVSRSTGEQCVKRGLPPERLFVTPNGIDPDRFGKSFPSVNTTREGRRKILAKAFPELAAVIDPNGLILCSVGRQVKRKGHEWFIRNVMPRLNPNVHLVLGGRGPETEAIAKAASEIKLNARVHMLGLVPEEQLATLCSGGDMFVMPNIPVAGDMEGFGVVMLEAGLCGMPSIAARLEGIQDVVTEGVNGFNVDTMDVAAYASVINRFAEKPDELDVLSQTARSHTIDTFSWPQVSSRIVDTLQTVIERKRA
jgi:phosphatidylinositol alpha-1,6-mannosyltransferase